MWQPDRHDLYELCVQRPALLAPWLRSLIAPAPDAPVLHEDFSGTAALCRRWLALDPASSAVAIDADADVLAHARQRLARTLISPARLRFVRADLADALPTDLPPADAIFAGNFSIGELPERADLLAYFRAARARLRAAPHSVLVCDTFAGAAAWRTGALVRTLVPALDGDPTFPAPKPPPGVRIYHTWEQAASNPLTSRVVCRLHFRVEQAGEITHEFPAAFEYHWRLWSPPEVRDALHEAGFRQTAAITDLLPSHEVFSAHAAEPCPANPDDFLAVLIVARP